MLLIDFPSDFQISKLKLLYYDEVKYDELNGTIELPINDNIKLSITDTQRGTKKELSSSSISDLFDKQENDFYIINAFLPKYISKPYKYRLLIYRFGVLSKNIGDISDDVKDVPYLSSNNIGFDSYVFGTRYLWYNYSKIDGFDKYLGVYWICGLSEDGKRIVIAHELSLSDCEVILIDEGKVLSKRFFFKDTNINKNDKNVKIIENFLGGQYEIHRVPK